MFRQFSFGNGKGVHDPSLVPPLLPYVMFYFLLTEYLSHDERQMRSHSQCFHIKGVPTLKLVCPGGDLIRVRQAFYGLPQENKTCTYEAHGDHCIEVQYASLSFSLMFSFNV